MVETTPTQITLLAPFAVFEQVLLICILFGAFGGLVAHFVNNEKRGTMKNGDSWFAYPSHLESALVGVAGALGFIFFLVAIGGISSFGSLTEQLRTVAVAVIAGFGARNLLPRMVHQLEKQIQRALQEADAAKVEAENAAREVREAREKLDALDLHTTLLEAAHPNAPVHFWQDALAKADGAIRGGTAKHAVWVNAARVRRWHGQIDEAIATLDDLIDRVEAGKLQKHPNYAAALYNRACYRLLQHGDQATGDVLDTVLADLEKHFDYSTNLEADIEAMLKDPDLKGLSGLDKLRAMIERARKKRQ